MKILFLILVAMILAGCEPEAYELKSGKVVVCKSVIQNHCGMRLVNCNDGRTYYCQTNLKRLKLKEVER